MAFRTLAALMVACAAIGADAAIDAKCKIASSPASFEVVNGGKLRPSTSYSCANVAAENGAVNYVEVELDEATIASLDTPFIEVVFWNVNGDYTDDTYEVSSGTVAANTNGAFFITTPTVDQEKLTSDPKQLATDVLPPNAEWGTNSDSPYWSVRKGTGNNPVIVGFKTTVDASCPGKYRFVVNAYGWTSGNGLGQRVTAGVLWRLADSSATYSAAPPAVSLGGSVTVGGWFPTSGTVAARVSGQGWSDLRYMLKSMNVSAGGSPLLFNANSPSRIGTINVVAEDGSLWGSQSTFDIETRVSGSTASLVYSWQNGVVDYAPSTGSLASGPAYISLSSSISSGTPIQFEGGLEYNIKENGPFVDVTIALETAEEFPTLSRNVDTLTNPSINGPNSFRVYMIKTTDPLVYALGANVASVSGRNNNTGMDVVQLGQGGVTVTSYLATPGTTQNNIQGTFSSPDRLILPHMSSFVEADVAPRKTKANPTNLPVQWAASNGLARPYVAFVRVSWGANCGSFVSVTSTVTAVSASAKGECSSNYDCSAPSGEHPSAERAKFSANGNPNRFSTCYLVFDSTGYGASRATTKCYECGPGMGVDGECGEGQYCHNDNGVCGSGTSGYVCDAESSAWLGICRNKSTEVLGQQCRLVTTSNRFTGNGVPAAGGATVQPGSTGAVFDGLNAKSGFAPGSGFCGEVRYYNETNEQFTFNANGAVQFKAAGLRRATLWEGVCMMGRCMECAPGFTPSFGNTGGKDCVNGRLVTPVTVDFTARTVIFNASASAAAAGAAFMALLLAATLCSMQNAGNRHRELFGEAPMGCGEVLTAMLFRWVCCCKSKTDRAMLAPFRRMAGVVSSSTPLAPGAAAEAGTVINPLEGKGADDWGTRH